MESEMKELDPRIDELDQALTNVGVTLDPILRVSSDELQSNLAPLQKVKLDVISLYAVNSLFWVYLKTKGEDPAAHGLPGELNRVKEYMKKIKEFEERNLAPKVNRDASKRVMRNALWSAAHKPKNDNADQHESPVKEMYPPGAAFVSKRKDRELLNSKDSEKKKDKLSKKKRDGVNKKKSGLNKMKSKKHQSKGGN